MLGRTVTRFMLDRSLVRAYSSRVPSGTNNVINKQDSDTKFQQQQQQQQPLSSSFSLQGKQPHQKTEDLPKKNKWNKREISFESLDRVEYSTRETEDFLFTRREPAVKLGRAKKVDHHLPEADFGDIFVPDTLSSFEPILKTSTIILSKGSSSKQPITSSSSSSSSPSSFSSSSFSSSSQSSSPISTGSVLKRSWSSGYNPADQRVPKKEWEQDTNNKRSVTAEFFNLIFSSPSKAEIEAFLEKGGDNIDVNAKVEKSGENALSVSVRLKNNRVLDVLIDKGVDINNVSLKGFTPFLTAVFEDNVEALQILLDRGCDYKVHTPKKLTALLLAIALERPNAFRFLLKDSRDHSLGIIPSSRFATLLSTILPVAFPTFPTGGFLAQLFAAVEQDEIKVFRVLLDVAHDQLLGIMNQPFGPSNLTLLSFTVLKKRHEFLKTLITNRNVYLRATSPPREWTAAHYAASENDLTALQIIFSNSKHINADVQDVHGRTPLYIACMHGAREAASFLLSRNADPLLQAHDGSSPFSVSASKPSSVSCLSLFCDFDLLDKDGNSALLLAARFGSQEVVAELLEKGFNPYFENSFALNAFALARQHNHPDVASLLVDRFVLDQSHFSYRPFPHNFPSTPRFM